MSLRHIGSLRKSSGSRRAVLSGRNRFALMGLRYLLERGGSITGVEIARDEADLLAQARAPETGFAIVDLKRARLGIPILKKLRQTNPGISAVVIIREADWHEIPALLRSGARGYILDTCEPEELLTAIGAVQRGEVYFSPPAAALAGKAFQEESRGGPAQGWKELSEAQQQVLRLVASGLLSKEIAEHLNLSIRTVEKHRAAAMRKLGLRNVPDLVRFAINTGLTSVR